MWRDLCNLTLQPTGKRELPASGDTQAQHSGYCGAGSNTPLARWESPSFARAAMCLLFMYVLCIYYSHMHPSSDMLITHMCIYVFIIHMCIYSHVHAYSHVSCLFTCISPCVDHSCVHPCIYIHVCIHMRVHCSCVCTFTVHSHLCMCFLLMHVPIS